jgi:hypothetical protein
MRSSLPDSDDAPRYGLYAIGVGIDLDAQFRAIGSLLERHRAADEELTETIKQLEHRARLTRSEHLIDSWVDSMHGSVYQDAAHSLAAVGMLAPLIESILVHSFEALKAAFRRVLTVSSSRAAQPQDRDKPWDCHWYLPRRGTKWKNDIVVGTRQLSDSIGLTPFLPRSTDRTLTALFAYRNKNLHNGLEWPTVERARFIARIHHEHWEEWFGQATTDGKPWIIYMSSSFVDHCLTFTEELLDGLGTFVLDTARRHPHIDMPP